MGEALGDGRTASEPRQLNTGGGHTTVNNSDGGVKGQSTTKIFFSGNGPSRNSNDLRHVWTQDFCTDLSRINWLFSLRQVLLHCHGSVGSFHHHLRRSHSLITWLAPAPGASKENCPSRYVVSDKQKQTFVMCSLFLVIFCRRTSSADILIVPCPVTYTPGRRPGYKLGTL